MIVPKEDIEEGISVRLTRDIERYPDFIAPEGATGTVTKVWDDLIAVELDEHLEGAEEWGNEVQWYADMFVDEDFREVFQEDVEFLEEGEG